MLAIKLITYSIFLLFLANYVKWKVQRIYRLQD